MRALKPKGEIGHVCGGTRGSRIFALLTNINLYLISIYKELNLNQFIFI